MVGLNSVGFTLPPAVVGIGDRDGGAGRPAQRPRISPGIIPRRHGDAFDRHRWCDRLFAPYALHAGHGRWWTACSSSIHVRLIHRP